MHFDGSVSSFYDVFIKTLASDVGGEIGIRGRKRQFLSMRLFSILFDETRRFVLKFERIKRKLNQQMAGGAGSRFSVRAKVNFHTFPPGKNPLNFFM